jgi:hypothetical protein
LAGVSTPDASGEGCRLVLLQPPVEPKRWHRFIVSYRRAGVVVRALASGQRFGRVSRQARGEVDLRPGQVRVPYRTGTGTSAGGILISRAATERPDLFGAIVCNVGVANALRVDQSEWSGKPASRTPD